jgi:glycosyltransferase involved in cell wall biosynthesis
MLKDNILIFIVAYNAEKTLFDVVSRIPKILLSGNLKILIIDDCSTDKTFEVGLNIQKIYPKQLIVVLKNPVNLGYGGNQKLGYRFAIENHFDIVALLHGDGQYAPEKLIDLIEPIQKITRILFSVREC